MSPLLLHSNTNQYNINGLVCTFTGMFRIQTCCNHILSAGEGVRGGGGGWGGGNMRGSSNFCQFYLVLSLFYSLQRGFNGFIAEKTILILYQGSRGVHYCPGGRVLNFFQGGPNANFYRNPYTYLLFSEVGCPEHLSPFGSAHGQCHHNGIIFITVPLLTIIVRHCLSGLMTDGVFPNDAVVLRTFDTFEKHSSWKW